MYLYDDTTFGGFANEDIFIGTNPMDEASIRAELDACLVNARRHPGEMAEHVDVFPA